MIEEEMMYYFQDFIQKRDDLKVLNTISTTVYPEAQSAILNLQKHILKTMTAGYDLSRPMREKGTANIDMTAFFPFVGNIDAHVTIDADSSIDLPKSIINTKQVIDATVTIDPPVDKPTTITAK